jgi:hypothetical protein
MAPTACHGEQRCDWMWARCVARYRAASRVCLDQMHVLSPERRAKPAPLTQAETCRVCGDPRFAELRPSLPYGRRSSQRSQHAAGATHKNEEWTSLAPRRMFVCTVSEEFEVDQPDSGGTQMRRHGGSKCAVTESPLPGPRSPASGYGTACRVRYGRACHLFSRPVACNPPDGGTAMMSVLLDPASQQNYAAP